RFHLLPEAIRARLNQVGHMRAQLSRRGGNDLKLFLDANREAVLHGWPVPLQPAGMQMYIILSPSPELHARATAAASHPRQPVSAVQSGSLRIQPHPRGLTE